MQNDPSSHDVPADAGLPAWQLPAPSHVSVPLQTSPSSQDVPAGSDVPAWQLPAPSHVSAPLQKMPSSQDTPAVSGALVHPAMGSQLSAVQALKSSHVSGVPDWQLPAPSQVSSPLQTSPSSQDVPAASGVKTHTPPAVSQLSVVQTLKSLQSASTTHAGAAGYSVEPAKTT